LVFLFSIKTNSQNLKTYHQDTLPTYTYITSGIPEGIVKPESMANISFMANSREEGGFKVVGKVDLEGNLTVYDSLALIKTLIRQFNIKVK
jgi:hypothetical protein